MNERDRLLLRDNPSTETQIAVIAKTLDDVFAWLNRIEKKVDTINGSVAKVTRDQGDSQHWHEMHEHSEGHASTLARIHDIEKKIGQQGDDLKTAHDTALLAAGVAKGRAQGLSWLEKAWLLTVAAIPTAMLILDRLS